MAGLVNGVLIRFANFTAIAATLAMYIGIQGLSFLLRDSPGGYINAGVVDIINRQIGPIPIAFLDARRFRARWANTRFAVPGPAGGFGRSGAIRRRRGGSACGSTGPTSPPSSCRLLFTAFGAVMLMAQIGVGDPRQGANYTLSSITAVVLGGTSLRGGRGTFIGTVLGALLLTEVLNAVAFLGLSETYQYVFQGGADPDVGAHLLDSAATRRRVSPTAPKKSVQTGGAAMNPGCTLIAFLKGKPEKRDELAGRCCAISWKPTRAEAGCVEYHLHISDTDPNLFFFYENWMTRKDLDEHLEMPYLKSFFDRRMDLLEKEVDLQFMTMDSAYDR